jgi:hypothetical protein
MSAIGDEDVYISAIGPSLIDCKTMHIYNQEDALEFISTKVNILFEDSQKFMKF